MTSDNTTSLLHRLQARRADIAERWYHAVARTSFMARSAADIHQALYILTEHILSLLFTETLDHQQAQTIGVTLAGLTYAQPEALGRTQEVLSHELVPDLSPTPHRAFQARVAVLLSNLAIGFTRQLRSTVLTEQEQLRTALVEQRKQVEAALHAQEHQLRMVVTNVPIVLFALDCHGVFTLAEGRGLAALGLAPEVVVGQSILDITATTPQIVENIHRALAGEAFTDIVEVEMMVFETRYAPLRHEQEQVVGVLGVAVDITERTQLQAELEALRSHPTAGSPQLLPASDPAAALTGREWDVLRLIIVGKTNREIGLALSISLKTVEKHINSVYTKLGVHTRVEVTTWALHHATFVLPERR